MLNNIIETIKIAMPFFIVIFGSAYILSKLLDK
jgi:hypothetical protein